MDLISEATSRLEQFWGKDHQADSMNWYHIQDPTDAGDLVGKLSGIVDLTEQQASFVFDDTGLPGISYNPKVKIIRLIEFGRLATESFKVQKISILFNPWGD